MHRYQPEFKKQVVKYVLDNKPSARGTVSPFMDEVAKRFGINKATLYQWMPGYRRRRHRHVNRGEQMGLERAAEKAPVSKATDRILSLSLKVVKQAEEIDMLKAIIKRLLKEAA